MFWVIYIFLHLLSILFMKLFKANQVTSKPLCLKKKAFTENNASTIKIPFVWSVVTIEMLCTSAVR